MAGGGGRRVFDDIEFKSTAGSPGTTFGQPGVSAILVLNCKFSGFNLVLDGQNGSGFYYTTGSIIANSEFTGNVSGIKNADGFLYLNNYFHGNSGDAIGTGTGTGNSNTVSMLVGNIIVSNSRGFVAANTTMTTAYFYGNVIANNTSDGINTSQSGMNLQLANNIIYGNGGWGVNLVSGSVIFDNNNNAYGSNTSGNRNNFSAGTNDVALSANPFTNSGSGDYSLNSTAGGGAALKGAGFPGVFPGGTTTSNLAIGAVQPAAGSTSVTIGVPVLQ